VGYRASVPATDGGTEAPRAGLQEWRVTAWALVFVVVVAALMLPFIWGSLRRGFGLVAR
jgi:hypothetical protein